MTRPPELLAIEYRSRDFASADAFRRRLQALLTALHDHDDFPSVTLTGLLLQPPQLFRPGHARQYLIGLRTDDESYLAAFADVCSDFGIPGLLGWASAHLPGSPTLWQGFGLITAVGAERPLIGSPASRQRTGFQDLTGAKFAMPGLHEPSALLDGLVATEARRQGITLLWGPGPGVNHPTDSSTTIISARQDLNDVPLDLLLHWMEGAPIARSRARLREIGQVARQFFFARSSSRV